MIDSLDALKVEVLERIQHCSTESEIEQLRIEILGRKGRLTLLLRGLKDLPADERPQAGQFLNQLRGLFEQELVTRLATVKESAKDVLLENERIDISLPGSVWKRGGAHPLTMVIDEILQIFLVLIFLTSLL